MAKIPGLNSSIADFWGRRGANPEILATTKLSGTLFEVVDELELSIFQSHINEYLKPLPKKIWFMTPLGAPQKRRVSRRKLTPSQIIETFQRKDLVI